MNKKALTQQGMKLAMKVVASQIILVCIAALLMLFAKDSAGYSLLVGGGIAIIPNFYFALKAFQYAGANQAQQVVASLYLGEAIKVLLTVVFFIAAFKWLVVTPGPLFLGYALALVMNWLALAIFKKSHQ